jgi:hypothetical protein
MVEKRERKWREVLPDNTLGKGVQEQFLPTFEVSQAVAARYSDRYIC